MKRDESITQPVSVRLSKSLHLAAKSKAAGLGMKLEDAYAEALEQWIGTASQERRSQNKYTDALLYVLTEGEPNLRDALMGLLRPYLGKSLAGGKPMESHDQEEKASGPSTVHPRRKAR